MSGENNDKEGRPVLDTTGWTDKDSKHQHIRALYEDLPYVEAYAKHTALRVVRDGPTGAIGRADEWETHGDQQLAFLRSRGLVPSSTLLDIGCGAGRLARKAVPFLEHGKYIGLDIAQSVLDHATQLSVTEGWAERLPRFLLGDGTLAAVKALAIEPDLVWAHSVVTHLPPELVRGLFADLAGMRFGQFLFTYKHKPRPQRSGLKQFQYPPEWFVTEADKVGLAAEPLPNLWPAGQRTIAVRPIKHAGMRVWRP